MFMIIGLTGTKASGKGEAAEFLKQQDFIYFSLSDFVREEATKRGLDNYSIKDLQDIGNDLREKYGLGVLAERAIEKIKQNAEKNFIIDGIRNPGEIEVLRRLKNFYLISFDAPQEQRFKWLVSRDRKSDPKTWEEFLKMDTRDQGTDEKTVGQKVSECMAMADFHIINDSTIEALREKIKKIIKKV